MSVFYEKGLGNEGYIKNLEVVAFDDLDKGDMFQMAMYRTSGGRYLIYGTMKDKIGLLDVTDPKNPLFIKRIEVIDKEKYPTTNCPKIQIADDLMIVAMSSGGGIRGVDPKPFIEAGQSSRNGICIYSLKEDPENPKFLSYWDNGVPWAMGVHRFMYNGGRYIHLSTDAKGFEGMIYKIIDIEDPTNPKEVGMWWDPVQYADGFPGRTFNPGAIHNPEFMDKPAMHGPPFVRDNIAYLGYSGAGFYTLDVSDVTRPRCLGHLKLKQPFGSELAGARCHTALPLPGRDFCVVTNEGERLCAFDPTELKKRHRAQEMNNLHMIDVSDPSHPTLVAEFPYPEVPEEYPYPNFNVAYLDGEQGPFGPHNVHEPMDGKPWLEQRGDRVYCCYFSAGLRIFDVSDPYYIKELGYFIPPEPKEHMRPYKGALMPLTEDLIVDERGYIYICCTSDGVYVLKMKE